jgi:Domain of unknown function (DUF4440)
MNLSNISSMKKIFFIAAMLFASGAFAQSKQEAEVLNLSKTMFRWEVENKIDSFETHLDDGLLVLGSNGVVRTKEVYVAELKNPKLVHNSINIQEAKASVKGKTAVLIGKGVFILTFDGTKRELNLVYMQTFIKEKGIWKLIGLQASRQP